MEKEIETVEVPIAFLHSLLDIRREHYIVCEMFKIPITKRGDAWVGQGITERIRTYLTSYVTRRSLVERETGAAFRPELAPLISDPEVKEG